MLKRYILFIALTFLVFWLYAVFFTPRRPPVETSPDEAEKKEATSAVPPEEQKFPTEKPTEAQPTKPAPSVEKPTVTPEQWEDEEKVWLENDYCRMTFTRYGAAVREVLLYTTQANKEVVIQGKDAVRIPQRTPVPMLLTEQIGKGLRLNPLAITSRNGVGLDLSAYPFDLKERTDRKLVYELKLDRGLKVTKSFELANNNYLLTVDLTFENTSEETLPVLAHQIKVGTVLPLDPRARHKEIHFLALRSEKIEKLKAKPKGDPDVTSFDFLRWASAGNKYFTLILSPERRKKKYKVIPEVDLGSKPPEDGKKSSSKSEEEYFYSLGIGVEGFDLKAGETIAHRYFFYAGPKEYDRLKRLGQKLPGDRQFERAMRLGWFGFVSVPLLKILKWFYEIIPNYGVAIILLTIVIKVVLYPLDQKSYRSMKEMQKLQPLIAELKKKYKDDPRQAQVEQMKLFKEHKVNPMGGCLPMLLQMPVLIAMFGMIRSAVELRRAPFFLWIKDLSEPDALLDFGVQIPIIGSSLNVLPVILVLTFVLQSKISRGGASAAQQDPQQKMMGHFMTVFFGIIFYNMPSGLNLYFAISTVLRAVQQYFVQKKG